MGAAPGGQLAPSATSSVRLSDSLSETATLAFVVRPTVRLRWEQLVRGARTDLPEDEALESVAATSRLIYEVTRRVGAFVQGQYLEQRGSDLVGEPFSRTLVTVGAIVGLAGPSRAWGVREEPEALQRVLPSGAERSLR